MKITLQSIGELEGGSVNTTKTELVFEYPEAGAISGFDFTPNANSELRTLTIGAVLKTKLPEFQQTLNQEYTRVYQEAKGNGYSDEEAAIQAQTAAINIALETATKSQPTCIRVMKPILTSTKQPAAADYLPGSARCRTRYSVVAKILTI